MEARSFSLSLPIFLIFLAITPYDSYSLKPSFSIEEATLKDLQTALSQNKLTSRQLVKFYFKQIRTYNPLLRGVIEVNPDALYLADKADQERKAKARPGGSKLPILHGIPVLVKDNIATKDKLNTTAGSYALLGSIVPRDATVVAKLRKAGAIILGKASLSQWSGFRTDLALGWNARSGQGREPYTLGSPCGSSSGSAISVSANFAAVTLGTETDASILCPSTWNSVVGLKPTIGLTSRAGVVPISLRQDTVGPICRTVSDAAYVLEAIVGTDRFDKATYRVSQYIPRGGYSQFLKVDGLKGKRLGIVADLFGTDPFLNQAFEKIFKILRKKGAILVKNVKIDNFEAVTNITISGELIALLNEFKTSLNAYLKGLVSSPIRSLADAIAFNNKHPKLEKIKEYGQETFLQTEATNGIGLRAIVSKLAKLSKDGLEKTIIENKLDAIISPDPIAIARILAIGGFPGITIPAGYYPSGKPFGIVFGGLKGYEPKLIEIAYGFEQATKSRKLPPLQKALK